MNEIEILDHILEGIRQYPEDEPITFPPETREFVREILVKYRQIVTNYEVVETEDDNVVINVSREEFLDYNGNDIIC
jgi:hypothetical protein